MIWRLEDMYYQLVFAYKVFVFMSGPTSSETIHQFFAISDVSSLNFSAFYSNFNTGYSCMLVLYCIVYMPVRVEANEEWQFGDIMMLTLLSTDANAANSNIDWGRGDHLSVSLV